MGGGGEGRCMLYDAETTSLFAFEFSLTQNIILEFIR